MLGGWFLLQLISLFAAREDGVSVAWLAHIGGFLTGFGLTCAIRRRLLIQIGNS